MLTTQSKTLIEKNVPARKVYLNAPQQRSAMIEANEEVAIWGRGTGKSEGLIAPRLSSWMHKMPRGLIGLVAATYQQHLTRTLPGILLGFERMGFVRDRDFFVGRMAPDSWRWLRPAYTPLKTEYFIHFRTGAGITLISQDRPGSANGLSLVAVAGDEAKFLNKERLDSEVMPAMRGYFAEFGHLSCYQATLFATDMPTSAAAEWLFELKDRMDQPRIQLVLTLVHEMHTIEQHMLNADLAYDRRVDWWNKYQVKLKQLNAIRSATEDRPGLAYYSEASSLENVDVLRPQWFRKQKNNLHEHNFNTSILNLRNLRVLQGFYDALSERIHGYDMYDNNYLETFYQLNDDIPDDCRQDADIIKDNPLDIALDYGGTFNCLVVGQRWPSDYRFIKSFYTLPPEMLQEVVLEFKRYYAPHPRKTVRYYYDHTAIGTTAHGSDTYAQIVMKLLRRKDEYGSWAVIEKYVGQQPHHKDRFDFWHKMLTEQDTRLPRFKYNRSNCDAWATSCNLTRTKEGRLGIEKDKTDEKKRASNGLLSVPQERAPHLSDAGDTLIYGALIQSSPSTGGGAISAPILP